MLFIKDLYQPVFQNHDYPLTNFFGKPRRFRSIWYVNRKWLEYGIDKDVVFCLYCYLFGQDVGKQGEGKTFVMKGFKLWNQKEKLNSHLGGANSAHNQAVKKSEDLRKINTFKVFWLSNQIKIKLNIEFN